MSRKVLLSFLGNNPYKKCRYTIGNFTSKAVRFVQEAIVQYHVPNWTENDQVFIFLTKEAASNNWRGAFYEGLGLESTLAAYPQFNVQAIEDIPSGVSEAEIWRLFDQLYACLEAGDQVYLDITNGFRSLPMLLMVLLDYAKALKYIQVERIYYGAFEVLGPFANIETAYPNPANRIAPILDLSSFSALQDWTAAAADFKLYGNIARLNTLTQQQLIPMLTGVGDSNVAIPILQRINQSLQGLIPLLQTNRGKALGHFCFNELHQLLAQLVATGHMIQPLTAVIHEIQDKIQHFKDEDALVWLKAAKWCSEHGLIQQGITQLQEGFVTWLCYRFQQQLDASFFDYTESIPRMVISKSFTIYLKNIEPSKWHRRNKENKSLTEAILADAIFQQAAHWYQELGKLRNDINHGGYQYLTAPNIFYERLNTHIEQITRIVTINPLEIPIAATLHGLVNLSAVPFADWPTAQQQLAKQQYTTIVDIAFPEVHQLFSKNDWAALVIDYYRQIKALHPKAVYIEGEMTFTFALVQRLKSVGIDCVTSVTSDPTLSNSSNESALSEFIGFRAF